MNKVISYQIADSIDLKRLKVAFTGELIYGDSEELFYCISEDRYVSVFRYGAVSFSNFDSADTAAFLRFIEPFCKNRFAENLSDEFIVETGVRKRKIRHNKIEITIRGTCRFCE